MRSQKLYGEQGTLWMAAKSTLSLFGRLIWPGIQRLETVIQVEKYEDALNYRIAR